MDGRFLNGQSGLVILNVGIESGHVFCRGRNFDTGISGEHLFVKEIGKGLSLHVVHQIRGQQSNAPCAAFPGCIHHRNGRIDGCGKDALAYAFGAKQTSVTRDAVNFDFLFLEQNVVADFEHTARVNLLLAERTNKGRPSASPVTGSPEK